MELIYGLDLLREFQEPQVHKGQRVFLVHKGRQVLKGPKVHKVQIQEHKVLRGHKEPREHKVLKVIQVIQVLKVVREL